MYIFIYMIGPKGRTVQTMIEQYGVCIYKYSYTCQHICIHYIFMYIFIYMIGPKGKTVQTMIEQYGLVNINLEDTGSVQIESFSYEKNEEVKEVHRIYICVYIYIYIIYMTHIFIYMYIYICTYEKNEEVKEVHLKCPFFIIF
jgi:hypothetical protein